MAKTWGELSQHPDFQSLSREEQEAVRSTYFDKYVAPQVAPELLGKARSMYDEKTLNRTWGDVASDLGVTALKGAVGLPEAIVGLADIPTGGRVGKALEEYGYRPGETQKILESWYSPTQKAANKRVEDAEGIVDTTVAAVKNPSVVANTILESLPLMGAGGLVGRGIVGAGKLAGRTVSAPLAAGAGEGLMGAGSSAETIRQQTPDGLLTPEQSALAAGSGAITGALGWGGGKLAQKTGLVDFETALAGATGPATRRGLAARVAGGAASEGFLEELPQSVQEQALQNVALGKPWDEGLDQAAVLGTLSGGVMGGGMNALSRAPTTPEAAPTVPPVEPPVAPPPVEPPLTPEDSTAPDAANVPPGAQFAGLSPDLQEQAIQNVAAGKPWDEGLGITDAEVVPPAAPAAPTPIPVVGPLSAAANAGQQAEAAGISSTPAPTAEAQAAQQQAAVQQQQAQVKQETAAAKDQAALQSAQLKVQQQQQEAAAKQAQQQQAAALQQQQAALKIKQEQLKVNQSEQKLGLGPTQFDEPALLNQASNLAALSQPTIDQPTQENANGLQAQTDAQVPGQVPSQTPNAANAPAGEVALATTQAPAAATGQASAPGSAPGTAPLAGTLAPEGPAPAPGAPTAGALPGATAPLATTQAPAAASGQTSAPAEGAFPGDAPLATTQAPAAATGQASAPGSAPLSNAPAPTEEQVHVDAFNQVNQRINSSKKEAAPRALVRLATEADLPAAGRGARRLAGAIASAFGHRVIYIASADEKAPLSFDGSVSPTDPTRILIANDAEAPVTRVVAHEVLHGLKRVAPEVYDNMLGSLRQLYDPQKVARHAKQRGYQGGLNESNEEEWVADFFSNTLHEPKSLAQVALAMDLKKTGAGLEFLNNLKEFIGRIIAKLRGDAVIGQGFSGADAAVQDLEQARAAVVKATAEYARARLTGKTAESLGAAPLSARKATPGAVAGAKKEIQQGTIVAASYKPGRGYGTARYPRSGGNLTRLHERMLKLTSSSDFTRLLDSLGLQTVGAQTTIRGMWAGEPEWTQALRLKQPDGTPATFEQARLVANLLGWAAQQDAGLTSMVVDKPVDGAFNIPSLYFGKADGKALTAQETDTALLEFAKITPGASVTPDGTAIKFLFFADDASAKSEQDQYAEFLAALANIAASVGLDPQPVLAYTLSSLDEFNAETNDNEGSGYRSRIEKIWGSVAQGRPAGTLSSGIIGRTVDSVLVPYIVNLRAEGFKFDFQRWGKLNAATRAEVADLQKKVEAYEQANKHGLRPRLRTTIDIAKMPKVGITPRIVQDTTAANAESQLAELDALKREFPRAADTAINWLKMQAHAFASNDVPIAPARLIGLMQNQGEGLYQQLSRLTPGQRHDADAGFANAAKFLKAYTSGKATQATTGKLLLWSFLSRGVSPYAQEAMFIDAVRGIDPFIEQAAAGQFGPAELAAYMKWANGVAKANGQGAPGNSTTHNLNAFGEKFLVGMSKRLPDKPGQPTKLEYLHSLIKDPTKSGRDIRREFVKIGTGVGIDNKVLSFTLLVTGRPDVLVLDRIQMRNLFNDGSFDTYNLYDGTYATRLITESNGGKETHRTLEQAEGEEKRAYKERVKAAVAELAASLDVPPSQITAERFIVPGSGLAVLTAGVRGQMVYELLEDKLAKVLPIVYGRLGRPEDASPGRYHWESWVVESGQEASHGTLDALLADVNGEPNAFADVPSKQGEYGGTDYGARYARDGDGNAYYLYADSAGRDFKMSPADWRGFLSDVNKLKSRAPKFLVSENQDGTDRTEPWYLDPRIDRSKLDEIIHKHGSEIKNAAPLSLRPDAASDRRDRGSPAAQVRPSYGTARPGAVKGTGVHYSRAERQTLDSSRYGTGIKGREAQRIAAAKDPRLKQRVYFYINNGTGISPEQGVGGYTHTVDLNNLYDLDADTLYLFQQGDTAEASMNAFESAVIDAGFDGYVADFAGQRAAVLVGPHQVPVRYEGLAQRPAVPAGERATPNPLKQVAALLRTPWMRQTPKAFGDKLKAADPDLYRQFGDQLTATDQTYWPGDMVKQLVPPDTVNATPADVVSWSRAAPLSLRTKPDPKKTVKAYKLFRLNPKRPGEIFPLFVKMSGNAGVPMGAWQDAEEGAAGKTPGKVASDIGELAYRPGWHAGDLPIATHIGGEKDKVTKKPTVRPVNQVWAEVELGADVDWQAEANSRGKTARDKAITDQIPIDGFYRYKTNANMTGNWLIGGTMRVNRLLSDAEVQQVNDAAGVADLPRKTPLDLQKFGFAEPHLVFSNRPTPNDPPAETRFRKAQRVVQDKFNRFRVIQDWLRTQGVKLSEAGDVYRAEERFHARVANQIEDFREQTLKPLVAKSQKAGFKMADIAQFLHAQHAEERNDAIAKINPKFPDGGSGMATQEARAILAAASPELKQIANEWRKIADDSLELKLQAGLITQEQADAFRNKYAYYVPLRGGPDDQLMVGTGKGLKVRHKEQRALGHPVREGGEWIVEQLLADREASIMKAEKALIAKHVLQMAVEMQRPDIISVEQPKLRQVLKNQASYVVTFHGTPVEAFQSLEAARVFRQMAGTQKGRSLIDFDIIKSSDPQVVLMASPMLADNEMMAYVAGHEIRIQLNDDLLARAYGNLGQDALGPILRAGRVLNTWLSKVYTGYNPEFILVNLMRDFTTGIANLSGEQGARMAMRAVKRYPKAFLDLLRHARDPARATASIRDYREDGGNTGAAYLDDLERIGTDVAAEYAKLQGVIRNVRERNVRGAASSAIGQTLKPLISWIEKLNQAGENAMRLAIYQAMRDSGKGRVAAASAAKNTTVNFNRKGELGLALNAWWLFFNASVQGTSAIAHSHFKGAHKGQAWAFSSGLIGTAYLASLLAAGDDEEDDEYEKISEYDRSRNLIIRTQDGFLKLPIPYGYGFFANLGRGLADAQRTGEVGKLPWHLATSFIEEYTPFGAMVAGKQPDWQQAVTFMGPTAWQIGAVPAYNRTSFGTPLYPTQAFKTEEFARDRMWRGTKGTWADELAGALEQTGMDVSPETLKHLWRTGTGGAGTFVTGILDAAQLKARGAEDLDAREIPLLRKFLSVPGVQEARARYYEAVEDSKTAKETFERFKKQGRFEEMETYQGENEALISMAKVAEKTSKRIKAARELYDQVKLDETLPLPEKRRQLRAMEVEETRIYDDYVRMFQERTRVAPR